MYFNTKNFQHYEMIGTLYLNMNPRMAWSRPKRVVPRIKQIRI